MNTRRTFTYILCVILLVSLTSFRKHRQRIYGEWIYKLMWLKWPMENDWQSYSNEESFLFNKDGTGIRHLYQDVIKDFYKEEGGLDTQRSDKYAYEISVPFTYKLRKDDIGNLVIIQYGTCTIDSVFATDDIPVIDFASAQAKKYTNREEKFYWAIRSDTLAHNRKAFQFIKPGTAKLRSFQKKRRKYQYHPWD